MKRFPIRLPPALYIIIFSQFHMANLMNTIGLTMFAVERFGAKDFAVGSLGGIMLLSYGSFAWMGGILADKYPKRTLIRMGLSVLVFTFWSVPYVESLVQMIALGAFSSLAFTMIMPSHFGLIGESVAPHRVSRYLGMNAMLLVLAGMCGAFLVGRLFESGGPMRVFHTSALISLATFTFLTICAPRNQNELGGKLEENEKNREDDLHDVEFKPHPHARAFFWGGLSLNFLGFFMGIMHQFFVVRLATVPELSMTLSEQSNLLAFRMFSAGLGYIIGVSWTGWHWRRWPFWVIGGLMLAVTIMSGFAPNPLWLTLAIGLGGVGAAMCNQMSLYYAIGGGHMSGGRGAGLNETALALGGASGPLVGGIIASLAGTPRGALFAPLLPLAVCIVVWWRLLPPRLGAGLWTPSTPKV